MKQGYLAPFMAMAMAIMKKFPKVKEADAVQFAKRSRGSWGAKLNAPRPRFSGDKEIARRAARRARNEQIPAQL